MGSQENKTASFADVVWAKVAHAPVAPTSSEFLKEKTQACDGDAIEPELVAAATNQGSHAEIHPTRATPGKQLPEGLVRNCIGFLLRTRTLEVQLDVNKVTRDMTHLKKFVVIAYFVGGRQSLGTLCEWINALRREIGEEVSMGRDLGRGFFHITTKSE